MNNLLIGVSHSDESEFYHIVTEINNYLNKKDKYSEKKTVSIGLELPEDYKERYSGVGGRAYFFNLAYILESNFSVDLKIIPLDDPDTWDENNSILTAENILDGKVERKIIEEELKGHKDTLMIYEMTSSPEYQQTNTYMTKKMIKRYEKALELLDEGYGKSKISELFQNVNNKRDTYMLQKIDEQTPNIIIVGNAHAKILKDELSDYEYRNLDEIIKHSEDETVIY